MGIAAASHTKQKRKEGDGLFPEVIYYEKAALAYKLGEELRRKYTHTEWIPIENHNNIEEMRKRPNKDFGKMKQYLIVGIRKTHRYVENHKVSDYLVPYTSSGCTAMCLYCYLVCNYNKCSYLRVFVNREQMLERLIRHAQRADREMVYEIGSNSDLILENTITGNLEWTIREFVKNPSGILTFPTKFDMVEPLLELDHKRRVIIRMSLNPQEIIRTVEFGTSPLNARIRALNAVCGAGYRVGILIAPVIMVEGWKTLYEQLIRQMADQLTERVKKEAVIEIIFMTYSFVQNAINTEAFPKAVNLYEKEQMTGRGRGKYCYRKELREDGEIYLRSLIGRYLKDMKILYVV